MRDISVIRDQISIRSKKIGIGYPCFIIAEAGVNHNGNLDIAHKLIDCAVESGADAIKFQTFNPDYLVTKKADKAHYQILNTSSNQSQYEMLKSLTLTYEDFDILSKYSEKKGILFLSTAFDEPSFSLVCKLNVPLYKIPSGEITNLPFIKEIGKKGKPILLSTGMATLGEIEDAINTFEGIGVSDIILLHCTSAYPAPIYSINLRAMDTLKYSFKRLVGYSDHSEGIEIPIAAVARGASVLEKHFTLDKTLPGPDHLASLEPSDLKRMIKSIRNIESALGDGIKKCTNVECNTREIARKSIVAQCNICKNSLIIPEMITIKRPGTGIPPKYYDYIIGKTVNQDINVDEPITWKMVD